MYIKNYFYYFKGALSNAFCDELIKYGNSKKESIGAIGEDSTKSINFKQNVIKKLRDSKVTWLNDPWIYNEILPYVAEANKSADWNYHWDWSEDCQFTKYSKGQFYDWHCDVFSVPYKSEDKNFDGKIRKLSVSINLTDPKEYSGGDLQFDCRNYNPDKRDKNKIITLKDARAKGSIIVFPSYVWHRVTKVTKGTRYSLVVWNIGQQFK
jgi:PKHD-type hydroxylase